MHLHLYASAPCTLTFTLTLASARRGWLRAVHGRHALLLETRAQDCRAWDQEGTRDHEGSGADGGAADGAGTGSGAGSGAGGGAGRAGGAVKAEGGAEAAARWSGFRGALATTGGGGQFGQAKGRSSALFDYGDDDEGSSRRGLSGHTEAAPAPVVTPMEAELLLLLLELLPLLLELRLLPDAAGPLPGAAPLDAPLPDAPSLDALSLDAPPPPAQASVVSSAVAAARWSGFRNALAATGDGGLFGQAKGRSSALFDDGDDDEGSSRRGLPGQTKAASPSPPSPSSPPSPPPPPLGSPAHLRSLVVLQLQGLRLTALPCSDALLRGLTGLRTLDCRRNRLCALPAALGLLGALESLLLDRNGLEALPDELGQLTALRTLSATHNGLTALPPSWRRLAELRTLRLQGNPLGGPQLAQLEQCTRLRLSNGRSLGTEDEVGAQCVTCIDELQAAVVREQRDGPLH